MVTACVARAYEARQERRVHPDGDFDKAKRWYPSDVEDADGDGSCVRAPSRAWPYSYMLRCRTRQHVRVLVERALRGEKVPDDIHDAVADMLTLLAAAGKAWDERRDDEVAVHLEELLRKSRADIEVERGPTFWDQLSEE